MAPDDIIDALQRHRAKLESKMEALTAELDDVRRQSSELEVAEKVVRRLISDSAPTPAPQSSEALQPISPPSAAADRGVGATLAAGSALYPGGNPAPS